MQHRAIALQRYKTAQKIYSHIASAFIAYKAYKVSFSQHNDKGLGNLRAASELCISLDNSHNMISIVVQPK